MSATTHTPQISDYASGPSTLELFVASVKRIRSLKTVKLHQQRLSYLAQHFDPFVPEASSECAQILALYQLEVTDPYSFTNTLLRMLDTLEEKQRLLQA
jgi:hypothetical protein